MIKFKSCLLSKKTVADIILLAVSLTWGLAYPLMHLAVKNVGPFNFLLIKYFFSSFLFIPFLIFQIKNSPFMKLFPYGFLLGILYFFACLFQAQGLERIAAGRNAFITGLVIVIVPLLSPLFHKSYPKKVDVITIFFVLIGMFLLLDPLHAKSSREGDIISLIGTVFFAFHLQALQKITIKFKEPTIFAFYQVSFITLFSSISLASTNTRAAILQLSHTSAWIWIILFTLGAMVTLAFFIQAKFQQMTTPSRAVLIYNLQPAIAAFFSFLILDEKMGLQAICGGAIVVFSVIFAQLYRAYEDSKQPAKVTIMTMLKKFFLK